MAEKKNDFGFQSNIRCCLDDVLICNGGNNDSIQRTMGKERMQLRLKRILADTRIEASEALSFKHLTM